MDAAAVSGSLLRLVVLLGALVWVPIWKRRAGGRARTYFVIAAGLVLLIASEAMELYQIAAASAVTTELLAWPDVYVHVTGYIAILSAFLLWVRDVHDSKETAATNLATERERLSEVRLNEAKLRAILNCATEYCIIVTDADRRITSYSSGSARFLGWEAEEVIGKMDVSALHPKGKAPDLGAIDEAIRDRGYFEAEVPYLRKDGTEFPALLTVTALKTPDGAHAGYVGIAKDITEIKSTRERLRRERDFVRGVIEVSELCIVGASLEDGRITMFNRGAERITGYERDEVIGRPYAETFLPPDIRQEVIERIMGTIKDAPGDGVSYGENPILTKSGERRVLSWTNSLCFDEQGRAVLVVSFGYDVTERRQMEESLRQAKHDLEEANAELARTAATDFLTGLVSRRQATIQFERELARCRRYHTCLGVIMMDLDRFKPVNDRYGHQAGDAVLAQVGRILKSRARSSDIVSRYGGEEFLLILPEASLQDTIKVAEDLRGLIRDNAATHAGAELQIRASFGVAEFNPGLDPSAQTLISRADEALYAAKGLGGNHVVSWQQLRGGKMEPAIADASSGTPSA